MSGHAAKGWWNPTRLVLTGLVLISLTVLLAWLTSRRAHLSQTPLPSELRSSPVVKTMPAAQSSRPTTSEGATGQLTAGHLRAQGILKYGHAAGEIGMVNKKDQPPVGPESFTVMKDGGVLVADVVNHRIAVYASDGAYLRAIELPGIALGDVMADAQGRVYVYDQVRHSLHQYDAQGAPQSSLDLSPKDIDTRGYFHITGSSIYFADTAVRDVLVATLQDGVLTPADKALQRTSDGIHGDTGRVYSLALDKGQALRLEVRDSAGQAAVQGMAVPLPGIVSARYAGEDQAQRFYVQTERLEGTRIVLEVLAFSPAGEHLGTTRMPENDYAVWTAKLVDVGTDGTIVQFLPQRDQAKLNLFAD